MKIIILVFFFCCLSSTLFAQQKQAEKCSYENLFAQGTRAAKDSLFDKALLCFNSARRCDPTKGKEIDDAINQAIRGIQKQKQTAIDERKRAEAQTEIAKLQKDTAYRERTRAEQQTERALRIARQSKSKELAAQALLEFSKDNKRKRNFQ